MGIFIPIYRLYCQLMVELGHESVQITTTSSASSPGSLTPHQAPIGHHSGLCSPLLLIPHCLAAQPGIGGPSVYTQHTFPTLLTHFTL